MNQKSTSMIREYGKRMYCFSPPVMLATFIIEICLAFYSFWRYKSSLTRTLTIALLLFLALFQFAEYNTCGRLGISAIAWSNIGYVAITLLPPLAIHLITSISKSKGAWRYLPWLAYATALPWLFLFVHPSAFSGHVCAGNYAIFQLANTYGSYYFTYYYSWLFIGIALSLYGAFNSKKKGVQQALILQTLGYLVFILPTAITNTVKPSTIAGIPSIMCGFAIIYAIILVFGILPLTSKENSDLT